MGEGVELCSLLTSRRPVAPCPFPSVGSSCFRFLLLLFCLYVSAPMWNFSCGGCCDLTRDRRLLLLLLLLLLVVVVVVVSLLCCCLLLLLPALIAVG